MPHHNNNSPHSALAILTELAVEGTSSFIETQRIFLNLAQQENDLLMNGVKERVAKSTPAAAMTDLVRRGLDALIDMQQELLTLTSKQTLQWLEAVQSGKPYKQAHLVELAREAMEKFVRARKKLLDVLSEETVRATSGKPQPSPAKKTEVATIARQAAELCIDAQKKVLDVLGQQMHTNLNAATQAVATLSPSRLSAVSDLPVKAVKSFFESEKSLLESLAEQGRKVGVGASHKAPRKSATRHAASA